MSFPIFRSQDLTLSLMLNKGRTQWLNTWSNLKKNIWLLQLFGGAHRTIDLCHGRPGIKPSALQVWGLSHWTTREVTLSLTFDLYFFSEMDRCSKDRAKKINLLISIHLFSCFFTGKESTCQCKRPGFLPWVRKIPWREKWQPTPVFVTGDTHGQRSLAGYSLYSRRVRHD